MAITLVGFADGNAGWGWPAGTQANDVAMIVSNGNGRLSGLTGWNALPYHEGVLSGSNTEGAWKVLTSGDVASPAPPPAISQGFCLMAVFRGASGIAEASAGPANTGASSLIPGFTKLSDSKAIVVFQSDRDPVTPSTIAYPSGFTGIVGSVGTYFTAKLSYLDSDSYAGLGITAPLAEIQYNGIGIAFEVYGDGPPSLSASFVAPKASYSAEASAVNKITEAKFTAPKATYASLVVVETTPPTEVVTNQTGNVFVGSNDSLFVDKDATYIAMAAGWQAPRVNWNVRLVTHPEIEAVFVAPKARMDALLEVGPSMTAEWAAPAVRYSANLEINIPLELSADFVAPKSSYEASVLHQELSAGFVAPLAGYSASLLGSDGIVVAFVAPKAAYSAELKNNLELSAEFISPKAGYSAQLGADERTLFIEFKAPVPVMGVELKNAIALDISWDSPKAAFTADLYKPEGLTANFVAPRSNYDATIGYRRIDAFFRAPIPRWSVNLDLIFPPTEGDMDYTFKKMGMEIHASQPGNSSLTFLLIQP